MFRRHTCYLCGYADGQEPAINNLLESLYLDNSRDLHLDFGPRVHEGPIRRRNVVRHSLLTRDGTLRRTEATLIANLTSHSETVTGLAVSPDHVFFVSCSDDKTVKVWDTARLERNVTSKPRHTYGQHHAKVKCVCIIEGTHCFASAADDGSLHIVRLSVTQSGALPKYGKLHLVREHHLDMAGEYITCVTHHNTGKEGCSNGFHLWLSMPFFFQIFLPALCTLLHIQTSPSWTFGLCTYYRR